MGSIAKFWQIRAVPAVALGCAVVSGGLGGGCAVGRGKASLDSDDPSLRVPGMKLAAAGKGSTDIPKLVEALESADPALRMFAINSLQRRTGETLGYRYYDTEAARAKAVARWRDYAGIPNPTTAPTPPTTIPTTQMVQTDKGVLP